MKQRTFQHQQGIALGPILFIIAILAILAAAIAAGSGEFSANTVTESDKANAETILQYTDGLKNAVSSILSNGCDVTQISFEQPGGFAPFHNTNAPSDYSCHVFYPQGGAVVWEPQIVSDGMWRLTNWWEASYLFSGSVEFANSGTTGALAMFVQVGSGVCKQLNNILGVPSIQTDTTASFAAFTGTFPTPTYQFTINPGKTDFCFLWLNGEYWFTSAIFVR